MHEREAGARCRLGRDPMSGRDAGWDVIPCRGTMPGLSAKPGRGHDAMPERDARPGHDARRRCQAPVSGAGSMLTAMFSGLWPAYEKRAGPPQLISFNWYG